MANPDKKIKANIREVVFSSEEGKSFCDIFVYEPENVDEQALGNLYIVGEIVDFSENSSYLVNLLASIIKKEFYSNAKRSTMESLEASLHKANSALSDLAEQGNVDWIGNLNMTCGTYKNGELHLSQTGKGKTMLVRNGQITDIGKNITNEEKPHPFKTFTNIASGELESGDLVLFITPQIFNIFSIEKLRQLASSLDIEELAEIIQDSVEKENDIKTIGLLLMKIEEEKEEKLSHIEIKSPISAAEEKIAVPAPENKIEELITVSEEAIFDLKPEKETTEERIPEEGAQPEEIIEGAELISSEKEERLSLEDIINKYEKREERENPPEELGAIIEKKEKEEDLFNLSEKNYSYEEKIEITNSNSEDGANNLADLLDEKNETRLKSLLKKVKIVFIAIKNKIALPVFRLIKKLALGIKGIFQKKSALETEFPQQIELLPGKKKFILIAFVAVMIIFLGGLIFKNYKDGEEKKLNTYASVLPIAEEKLNQAEIDAINNPAQARKSLSEAKSALTGRDISLDNKTNYKETFGKITALLGKIQTELDIIDLVSRIENPAAAIDFSQTENAGALDEIMGNAGNYYAFNSKNKTLSGVNFADKSFDDFAIKAGGDINFSGISTLMKKTREAIFLSNSNKAGIFNIGKKTFSGAEIELPTDISNIKDIASYSNFLYLLDPNSNQIYKHARLANGFDKGQSWFKAENINIKNAVSMAIDGSIYLLNSDGSIDKFRTGDKVAEFSIESPSEQISNSAKIYTESEFKYLYVSDPDKNRIVLFDKTSGKLVRQYISNDFNSLKDIVVNEKEEKIYALGENKIFEVGIEK
ncbi:hypothetical protein KKB43_07020 [Patescibacteria group bacterium]|nr:hypothetical protein [Patescibacteria group bacterium]